MYINLDKTEIENLINLSKNEYDNLYYQLLDLFDLIPKLSNIDENWELREDDPIVQTWQSCEDKLPEDLKEEWDD